MDRSGRKPRGQSLMVIIMAVALVAALGIAGLSLTGGDSDSTGRSADSFAARRGGFDITIPVSGELAALNQIEIRNKLDGRAIITEIMPEGTFAKAGEVLLRLNDDEARTEVREAQDEMNVAEAALIAATAKLDIAKKTRESEIKKAQLAITLAELALQAWREGELISKRQELALAIETAQKEYDRLLARFKESAGLLEQKFISLDEYKRDEIAMIQAEATLKQARLDQEVYEKYTYQQEKAQKESDLEQAHSELDRVTELNNAEVTSAQSDVDSKKFQLESAIEELAEDKQQLEFCMVRAPSDGLVVYYSSLQGGGGRNEGRPPQVGTELSRNEPVIVLPDTSKMVASVKVSEVLSGWIRPGQRAVVTSDAMPDRAINGEVISVGVLAESGGWRDPNRRDYTVRILLHDGNDFGLKPSMRCKAVIYVGRVDNAIHVPVQAVLRNGPLTYVYVPQSGGYAQRQVSLGRSSELYVEITDGLAEGETVMLREPGAEEIVSRLAPPPNEQQERRDGQAESESGSAANGMQDGALQRGGPGRQREGDAAGGEQDRPRRGDGQGPGRRGGGRNAPPENSANDNAAPPPADDTPKGEPPPPGTVT